jgi:YD repeat-containing protein
MTTTRLSLAWRTARVATVASLFGLTVAHAAGPDNSADAVVPGGVPRVESAPNSNVIGAESKPRLAVPRGSVKEASTDTYHVDQAGKVVFAALSDGRRLRFTYDASGRLVRVNDAQGGDVPFTLSGTSILISGPGDAVGSTRERRIPLGTRRSEGRSD